MSCAARAPQSRIDERKSSTGKRNEQDQDKAEGGGRFRERRSGKECHPLSPCSNKCERATSTIPMTSTPTPASTKPVRGCDDASSATAARTIPPPAKSRKKPASFMEMRPRRPE